MRDIQSAKATFQASELSTQLHRFAGIAAMLYSFAILYLSFLPTYHTTKSIFKFQLTFEPLKPHLFFEGDFLVNLLAFLPLGLILGLRQLAAEKQFSPLYQFSKIILICASISLVSETSQIFINFRVLSVNDLLAQVIGAISGALLALVLFKPHVLQSLSALFSSFSGTETYTKLSYFFIPCSMAYIVLAVYYSWGTIMPNLEESVLASRLEDFFQLPFAVMMRGSYVDAAKNCSFAFLCLIPLGMMMTLPGNNLQHSFTIFVGVLVSVAMELGQVIFGSSYPDISVSLILFFGFLAGTAASSLLFSSYE